MKKIVFLLLPAFLMLISSCNKDGKDNVLVAIHGPQTLPGSWELRSYYGGYSATGGGTFEAGNGSIYIFTDEKYTYYSEGNPHDSGAYKLTTAPNPNTGDDMSALLFNGNVTYPVCYKIKDDTLTLYHGSVAADGTIDRYVRIANAEK